MSFVATSGVSKWSQITIDADKNMLGFGMSNMKQVAAAMVGGDLIAKGLGGILVRIPAGIANTVLTSAGIGLVPTWAPGGLYLNRYIPANINISKTLVTRPGSNESVTKPGNITSVYYTVTGDDIAHLIKLLSPAITMPKTVVSRAAPEQSASKTPAIASKFDLQKVVDGAVADDGGVQTTETAAAQSAAANDMTLLPALPVANDAYYFGFNILWDKLTLNIGIAGNGVWTITWEYYDADTTWHALAGVTDGTTHFRAAAGNHDVLFTRPAGWALTNINAAGNMYWIRGRCSAFTSIVTQPKGTQAFSVKIT